jgi:hypothetical protein
LSNCIGLFGTCGNSKWRDAFEYVYRENNIEFFNPLVEDWKPEDAVVEAEHLANDNIILFPITKETYGVGSLSEVGFGVLSAIKLDDRRDFVVMIENELVPELMEDADRAKESLRARALVLQHLKKLNLPNVYLVDKLTDMLDISTTLYHANKVKDEIKRFSIKEL